MLVEKSAGRERERERERERVLRLCYARQGGREGGRHTLVKGCCCCCCCQSAFLRASRCLSIGFLVFQLHRIEAGGGKRERERERERSKGRQREREEKDTHRKRRNRNIVSFALLLGEGGGASTRYRRYLNRIGYLSSIGYLHDVEINSECINRLFSSSSSSFSFEKQIRTTFHFETPSETSEISMQRYR